MFPLSHPKWKPKVPSLDTWEGCEGNILWPGEEHEFSLTSIRNDSLRSPILPLYVFKLCLQWKYVTISILLGTFNINPPFSKAKAKLVPPVCNHSRSKFRLNSNARFRSPAWSGYLTKAPLFEALSVWYEYIWTNLTSPFADLIPGRSKIPLALLDAIRFNYNNCWSKRDPSRFTKWSRVGANHCHTIPLRKHLRFCPIPIQLLSKLRNNMFSDRPCWNKWEELSIASSTDWVAHFWAHHPSSQTRAESISS